MEQFAEPPSGLSREQLKGFLKDFLDQLIASKPPALTDAPKPEDQEIIWPSQEKVNNVFQAYKQGGKEALLKLFQEREKAQQPPPEQEITVPSEQDVNDSFAAYKQGKDALKQWLLKKQQERESLKPPK